MTQLLVESQVSSKEKRLMFVVKKFFRSLPNRIPAFGLILALISVFFFSMQSVIVNLLTDLHSIEILVFRCIMQFTVYGLWTMIKKYPIFGTPDVRLHIANRCIVGTVSVICIYLAYRLMPIADASTIHFSSPVFVTVFAYFMLKEPLTILQITTGIFTIAGVVIISKPEFIFGKDDSEVIHEHRLEGTILAVVASVTGAFVQISLRKMKNLPVPISIMWFALTVIVTGVIILAILDELVWPTGLRTWGLLVACGVCGIGDQFFFTLSFHFESAGPISVTRTFNIVLSFVWGIVILKEDEEWTSFLGASIVTSCILLLTLYKWKNENPSHFHKVFSKLCCCCLKHKDSDDDKDTKPAIDTVSNSVENACTLVRLIDDDLK